jgi:hypothetical protein
MSTNYLDELRALAESCGQEETAYREESQKRLAALADRRARAYRRYNLVREMIELARPVPDEAACIAAQTTGILAEAGWSDADAAYREVAEALAPVARLVHADLHGLAESAPRSGNSVPRALETFEAWYRERFGTEFPALQPRDAPSFQPLVDF